MQLYDEKKYREIGTLDSNASVTRLPIPPLFIEEWLTAFKSVDSVEKDYKYADDNYLLVDIVARLTGNKVFRYYAERWKDSYKVVPVNYRNRKQPSAAP